MTTARNLAADRIRRDRTLATKLGLLAAGGGAEVPMEITIFNPADGVRYAAETSRCSRQGRR